MRKQVKIIMLLAVTIMLVLSVCFIKAYDLIDTDD